MRRHGLIRKDVETTPRHRWTCQEDLAVLHLKLEYGESVGLDHPAVFALGRAMEGSAEASLSIRRSIRARKNNLDALERGTAFDHAAQCTERVWQQYREDPGRISEKAREAFRRFTEGKEPR